VQQPSEFLKQKQFFACEKKHASVVVVKYQVAGSAPCGVIGSFLKRGQLFLAPSLSGPTHLLRWVVQTDVAFYFMPGAQQQAQVCADTPIISSQDLFNIN
jgi:hypothetical protein